MIRALILPILWACLGIGVAFWTIPAWGHSWYDLVCCHDRDCAPIPVIAKIIDVGPAGVVVRIEAGQHPLLPYAFGERFFAWDDPYLRRSQDEHWHVCISPSPASGPGTAHRVLCVYMPDMGV